MCSTVIQGQRGPAKSYDYLPRFGNRVLPTAALANGLEMDPSSLPAFTG